MEEAHYYNFTGTKAGMEGIDRETINQIIHDASKNSNYYKKQQRKGEQLRQRVEEMRDRVARKLEKGPIYTEPLLA